MVSNLSNFKNYIPLINSVINYAYNWYNRIDMKYSNNDLFRPF